MITYIEDLEQGTPEWLQTRMGIITASVTKQLLTKTFQVSKDKKLKVLALDIAAQRIIDKVVEPSSTRDMERGHVEEELAKAYYSEAYEPIRDCGFVTNDNYGFTFGFSPDGLIGDDGFVEVKSRLPKYQVLTIYLNEIPDEYMVQIQTGFLACEREWCDFIQFSNGMPLFVKREYPNPAIMESIKVAMTNFEEQVQEAVDVYEDRIKDMVQTEFTKHDLATRFVGDDEL